MQENIILTRLCIFSTKNEKFWMKNCVGGGGGSYFCLVHSEYFLKCLKEAVRLNKQPRSMFLSKNKKKMYTYPSKPKFYCIGI